VWGGPLSNGDYVMALFNRGASPASITGRWRFLGVPGLGDDSVLCARDLWAGKSLGPFTGAVTRTVASHDLEMLRLSALPCAAADEGVSGGSSSTTAAA